MWLLVLASAAVVSAVLSWLTRTGVVPWWYCLAPSLCASVAWAQMARRAESLSTLGVLVDVVLACTYLATFWLLGERLSGTQWCGAVVALLGVALMAWSR